MFDDVASDPPTRAHKPSIVAAGGLFGVGALGGEAAKQEQVRGGLFDGSDDEKEYQEERRVSNVGAISDLLGGGADKIAAAAKNKQVANIFAVEEADEEVDAYVAVEDTKKVLAKKKTIALLESDDEDGEFKPTQRVTSTAKESPPKPAPKKALAALFAGGDITAGGKEETKAEPAGLPKIGGAGKKAGLPPPPAAKAPPPKEEFAPQKLKPKKTLRFADSDDDDSDDAAKKDKNTFKKKPTMTGNAPKMSMLFNKDSDDDEDEISPTKRAPAPSQAKAKPKPKKSVFAKEESSDSDDFKPTAPVKKETKTGAAGLPSIGKAAPAKAAEKKMEMPKPVEKKMEMPMPKLT